MKEKITVLIADDNQEFSKTLATYLGNEKDMEVVGIAKDGVEAVEQIKELLPDELEIISLRNFENKTFDLISIHVGYANHSSIVRKYKTIINKVRKLNNAQVY